MTTLKKMKLTAIAVFAFAFACIGHAATWQSSANYASEPYFYGLIEVRVPTGTLVDLSQGMWRTMAHDVFDGDITHKVQRVSPANPVINTASAGTTAVSYTVTNSRGVTSTITVNIIVQNRANVLMRRRIHSRPDGNTRDSEIGGSFRGNNHCAQHLGIFMPPNSNFRIRRIQTPIGGGNLTLRNHAAVQANNSRPVTNVGTDWATISHGNGLIGMGTASNPNQTFNAPNMGRVPLISTPRSDNGHFEVELEFTLTGTNSIRGLNYFHYGDQNQAQFLSNWTEDHTFAVIASNTVIMIVPFNDRNALQGQATHSTNIPIDSINGILAYSNEQIMFMNNMHGFCIEASERFNRLVHTRFLVVPAFGGWGAAFYGQNYTGMSSAGGRPLSGGHTIYPYLMRSHLKIHEYAHGYDGHFSRTRENGLIDITTNVYVHFFRRNYAPQNRWWLLDYGNLTWAQAEDIAIAPANGTFPSQANLRNGLIALVSIMDIVGTGTVNYEAQVDVWRHIRQLDRQNLFERNESWSQGDLFAVGFFEKLNLNIIPYLEWLGFDVTDRAKRKIFGSDARMPYYLQRLAGIQAQNVQQAEGIRGLWDAVLPNPARGLNANATITFEINDLSRIVGQTFRVMDGGTLIHQGVVPASGVVTLNNLPIGAYSVIAPTPTTGIYNFAHGTMLVRHGMVHNSVISFTQPPYPISRVRVNSWETSTADRFVPTSLFDGDLSTFWHARWSQGSGHGAGESFVDIDLGTERTITRIEVDKRLGGGADRNIRAVRMFRHAETGNTFPNGERIPIDFPANVSQAVINADFAMTGWTAVTPQISGLNTPNTVVLTLATPITARYIRLGIENGTVVGAASYTQVAEIRVLGSDDVACPDCGEYTCKCGGPHYDCDYCQDTGCKICQPPTYDCDYCQDVGCEICQPPTYDCDYCKDAGCEVCQPPTYDCDDCKDIGCEICQPTSIRPDLGSAGTHRYGIILEENPVSHVARISVVTPEPVAVNLRILDVAGNTVFAQTQCLRLSKRSENTIIWDLHSTAGRDVSNGIYLIHVEATGISGKIHRYATRIVVKR